ncbi:hypothetical protein DPMN_017332 [Dreissena polymorpha]|uniref:Uncharacterized protein n=1 Tax=Dreissena polymorpha TaxID=45954 RepID=A0A9D4S7C1_DREPO|nr:hypothetical protein DPMN_017332 [Dreissena polymorpha]
MATIHLRAHLEIYVMWLLQTDYTEVIHLKVISGNNQIIVAIKLLTDSEAATLFIVKTGGTHKARCEGVSIVVCQSEIEKQASLYSELNGELSVILIKKGELSVILIKNREVPERGGPRFDPHCGFSIRRYCLAI